MRRPTDNPTLYRVLGRRIASARAEQAERLSQSALAKKVGLTRGSIANIELGEQRPPLHVFWAIAQALGVEPASLLPAVADLKLGEAEITPYETLEPKVAEVVEQSPRARAWLSTARTKVGASRKKGA